MQSETSAVQKFRRRWEKPEWRSQGSQKSHCTCSQPPSRVEVEAGTVARIAAQVSSAVAGSNGDKAVVAKPEYMYPVVDLYLDAGEIGTDYASDWRQAAPFVFQRPLAK
jgi:hypothetical protein